MRHHVILAVSLQIMIKLLFDDRLQRNVTSDLNPGKQKQLNLLKVELYL